MAYDPDLDLLYFGTGNPVPNDQISRGHGDGLYSASIIAVKAATGRMAWYYQTTPGDIWDYDAVQKMILADLTLDGRPRKVLMQANKNGYFYVIDRTTGEVISAKPFVYLNWSKGMDAHFRPILDPQADFTRKIILIYPAAAGAHSWQPMSYDRQTGLVYIPVFHSLNIVGKPENSPAPEKSIDGTFQYYWTVPTPDYDVTAARAEVGSMPKLDPVDPKTGHSIIRSVLTAWNPVTQREVWAQPVSEGFESMEGGVMSTAGNLVFQGTSKGELRIYAADNGKLLRSIATGTAMMAAPATYLVDGVQYVAVMAGFGGDAMGSPLPPNSAPAHHDNAGRILVFRLGGSPEVPQGAERVISALPVPPPAEGTPADIARGAELFGRQCGRCHGGGLLPDLTRMEGGVQELDLFKQIVLGGLLAAGGMERFDDALKPHDVEQIHAYLVDQAIKRYARQSVTK
jgi:quinohemoprotein ethanol dehydrogenase